MVATKTMPNNKRRGGFNGGMPYRQRFKSGAKQLNARAMGAMFNTNQLGDNPGFVDFNDDVQIPPATTPAVESTAESTSSAAGEGTEGAAGPGNKGPNKGGQNNRKGTMNQKRQNMRNGGNGMRRMPPGMNGYWGPPMPPMFGMGGGRRNGPFPPPPPHFRVPPMGMRGMRGGPMMPPPPPEMMRNFGQRFPMRGPMPPMPPMRGPMMGGMMPPPLRNRSDGGPPMRRNPNGKFPPGSRAGKGGKGGPRNAAPGKGSKPSQNNKKTAKSGKQAARPREEYPLDKPWVTDEIRGEHEKKVQLADRLKGNKDDALFAQFKEQRDKFVKMYDAARLEFIGKHPEQDVDKILTESEASKNAKPENQKSNDAVSTDTSAATTSATEPPSAAPDASSASSAGAQ